LLVANYKHSGITRGQAKPDEGWLPLLFKQILFIHICLCYMRFTCVERPKNKYSVLTSLFIQTKFHGLLFRHSFSLHIFNHLIKKFYTASSIQYTSLFISLRYMLFSLSLLSCDLPSYLTQVTFKRKLLVLVRCPSAC